MVDVNKTNNKRALLHIIKYDKELTNFVSPANLEISSHVAKYPLFKALSFHDQALSADEKKFIKFLQRKAAYSETQLEAAKKIIDFLNRKNSDITKIQDIWRYYNLALVGLGLACDVAPEHNLNQELSLVGEAQGIADRLLGRFIEGIEEAFPITDKPVDSNFINTILFGLYHLAHKGGNENDGESIFDKWNTTLFQYLNNDYSNLNLHNYFKAIVNYYFDNLTNDVINLKGSEYVGYFNWLNALINSWHEYTCNQ